MGGDFAHFFLGAKVDGDSSWLFSKEGWQPSLVFIDIGPAEASLDGYR